jgi:hypothetical protein
MSGSSTIGNVFDASIQADADGNVTIDGDLTVDGTVTTISTVNLTIEDKLIELAHGTTGTPSGDAGIIIERGDEINASLLWDESANKWAVSTTTATGASSGDLAFNDANLQAADLDLSGNLDVVGRTSANLVVKADNETGGTLTKGTPVYVSATHASGRPSVAAADANGSGTYPSIGLVWADIADTEQGYITEFGVIEDVSYTAFVGTNPAVGDTIYMSETAGKLTVDRPSAPGSQVQNIGRITKTNVVVGASGSANVLVQGPGRTNDTPNNITAFSETLTYATSDTNAGTFTALDIDFDKTGASSSNNTMIGINIDMDNTTATSGTNTMKAIQATPTLQSGGGILSLTGMELVLTGDSSPEDCTVRALDLTATGGDYNQGIFVNTDDANGWDMRIVSSANTSDHCTIKVEANGETTITTNDADAALAHLNLTVDGNLVSTAATAVTVQTGVTGIPEGVGVGDVIAFGAEDLNDTLAAGKLMYLDSVGGGTWKYADADAEASTKSLIAVALGTNISDGLLTKGFFKFAAADIEGTFTPGAPCFISEASGKIDFTAPSAAGDFVRVIGYGTDTTNVVYFNPSGDWIAL